MYIDYGAEMGNSLNILKKGREVFPMKLIASRLYSSTVSNFLLAWCFIWPAFLENLKKNGVGRDLVLLHESSDRGSVICGLVGGHNRWRGVDLCS